MMILKCNKILLQQSQEIIRLFRIRYEGTAVYVGAGEGEAY